MSTNRLKLNSQNNQSTNNLNDDGRLMKKSNFDGTRINYQAQSHMQRGSSVQPIYQPTQTSSLNLNQPNFSQNISNSNVNFDTIRYDLYSSRYKFPSYNSLSFESINNPSNYNNFSRNFSNRFHLNKPNEGFIDKELTSRSQQYLSFNLITNDKFSSTRESQNNGNIYDSKSNLANFAQTPLNLSYSNLRSHSPVATNRSYHNNNNSISNLQSSSLLPLNNIAIVQHQQLQLQQQQLLHQKQQQQAQFSGFHGFSYLNKNAFNPSLVPNKLIDLKHSPSLPINQPYDQYANSSSSKTITNTNYNDQETSSSASQNNRFLKLPESVYETSSLRSLRDVNSLSSTILNHKDSIMSNSITNDSISNISASTLGDSNAKVMENYLILDRLNQKQQRKQQIKLKQQQQIDDLKQKQQSLEIKHIDKALEKHQNSIEQQNTFINSKLTAHYNETVTNNVGKTNSNFDQTKFKLKVHHPSQLQQFQLNQKLNSQNQFIQNSHDLKESYKTISMDNNLNYLSSSKLPRNKTTKYGSLVLFNSPKNIKTTNLFPVFR